MRCHFIPQFILKEFSIAENRRTICKYSKHAGTVEESSIEDSFQGENFYCKEYECDTESPTGEIDASFEDQLTRIESRASGAIRHIIESDGDLQRLDIYDGRRNVLGQFLRMQPYRNPYVVADDLREQGLHDHADMMLLLIQNPDHPLCNSPFGIMTKNMMIDSLKKIRPILKGFADPNLKYQFIILHNPKPDMAFFTGNFPHAKYAGNRFLGWMPVSPRSAIFPVTHIEHDRIIEDPKLVCKINRSVYNMSTEVVIQSVEHLQYWKKKIGSQ